jgi:type II secretory pathway component GspD/PulD (secretin)
MIATHIHRIAIMASALTLFPLAVPAGAQESAQDKPASEAKPTSREAYLAPYRIPSIEHTRTFYLSNTIQQNDANEILVAIRNVVDPSIKIYLVASQNAIVMSGPPDQIALAEKIIKDLDRPRKSYRLTYTITESDSGKRIGIQHFSLIAVDGQKTTAKQGSKVPIAIGSLGSGTTEPQEQFTYLDVGMSFDVSVDQVANGVKVRSKVEQSSLAEEKSGVGEKDPIVRQTVLEGTYILTDDKPLVLGTIDIPGSTRHQDIEVVAEQMH